MAALDSGVLEPEAMETAEEVRQYDAMDHSQVNDLSSPIFCRPDGACRGGEILDVGTGTARIPIALAKADMRVRVLVDLSPAMRRPGQYRAAGLTNRIKRVLAMPNRSETY